MKNHRQSFESSCACYSARVTNPPDSDEREIAARLKLWRTKRMIPQATFARAINLQPTTLWTYEIGRVPVKAKAALEAWRSLNLSPHWLRGSGGPETLDFKSFGAPLARILYPRPRENFSTFYDSALAESFANPAEEFPALIPIYTQMVNSLADGMKRYGVAAQDAKELLDSLADFREVLLQQFEWIRAARKSAVDISPSLEKMLVVKNSTSEIAKLRTRLSVVLSAPGAFDALVSFLEVKKHHLQRWLSGPTEPGGETTLRLLEWVNAVEASHKEAAAAQLTQRRQKTQARKSANEKQDSDPPRK